MANEDTVSGLTKFIQQNPVLIRGIIVTIVSAIALAVGHSVISDDTITLIVDSIISVSGLIGALWSRGKVIAENKVIAWNPDPTLNDEIVAGLATVTDVTERWDDLRKAASESRSQKQVRAERAA